jgi:hypothetical protein
MNISSINKAFIVCLAMMCVFAINNSYGQLLQDTTCSIIKLDSYGTVTHLHSAQNDSVAGFLCNGNMYWGHTNGKLQKVSSLQNIASAQVLNDTLALALSANGLLITHNKANTWSNVFKKTNLQILAFVADTQTVVAIAKQQKGTTAQILWLQHTFKTKTETTLLLKDQTLVHTQRLVKNKRHVLAFAGDGKQWISHPKLGLIAFELKDIGQLIDVKVVGNGNWLGLAITNKQYSLVEFNAQGQMIKNTILPPHIIGIQTVLCEPKSVWLVGNSGRTYRGNYNFSQWTRIENLTYGHYKGICRYQNKLLISGSESLLLQYHE